MQERNSCAEASYDADPKVLYATKFNVEDRTMKKFMIFAIVCATAQIAISQTCTVHPVRSGETLSQISKNELGRASLYKTYKRLQNGNLVAIRDFNRIYAGETLATSCSDLKTAASKRSHEQGFRQLIAIAAHFIATVTTTAVVGSTSGTLMSRDNSIDTDFFGLPPTSSPASDLAPGPKAEPAIDSPTEFNIIPDPGRPETMDNPGIVTTVIQKPMDRRKISGQEILISETSGDIPLKKTLSGCILLLDSREAHCGIKGWAEMSNGHVKVSVSMKEVPAERFALFIEGIPLLSGTLFREGRARPIVGRFPGPNIFKKVARTFVRAGPSLVIGATGLWFPIPGIILGSAHEIIEERKREKEDAERCLVFLGKTIMVGGEDGGDRNGTLSQINQK